MKLLKLNRKRISYLVFSLGASAIMLVKSAVYARLLGVEVFGFYSKFFLLGTITTAFVGLGYQHLCRVVLPGHFSHGDTGQVGGVVMASVFAGLLGWLLGCFLATLFFVFEGDLSNLAMAFVAVSFGFLYYIYFVLLIRFSSEMEFLVYAKGAFLRSSVITLAGTTVALLVGSAFGVLLSELVFLVLVLLLFLKISDTASFFRESTARDTLFVFKGHFKQAASLLVLNSSVFLLISLDKWLAAISLSDHLYGIYAVGLIILAAFDVLQLTVNNAVFPVMSRLASDEHWDEVRGMANRYGLTFLLLGSLFLWPMYQVSAFLIDVFYPDYVGLKSILILMLITGVIRIANFYGNVIQILGAVKIMIPYYLTTAALGVLVVVYWERLSGSGYGVEVFAWFALYLSVMMVLINGFMVNRMLSEDARMVQ